MVKSFPQAMQTGSFECCAMENRFFNNQGQSERVSSDSRDDSAMSIYFPVTGELGSEVCLSSFSGMHHPDEDRLNACSLFEMMMLRFIKYQGKIIKIVRMEKFPVLTGIFLPDETGKKRNSFDNGK